MKIQGVKEFLREAQTNNFKFVFMSKNKCSLPSFAMKIKP